MVKCLLFVHYPKEPFQDTQVTFYEATLHEAAKQAMQEAAKYRSVGCKVTWRLVKEEEAVP